VIPFRFISRGEGTSRGWESYVDYTASPSWRLTFGYSDLDLRFTAADASPDHQYQLRSFLDLSRRTQLDATLYHVDRVRSTNVPAYQRLDLRFGWKPAADTDVSLVCQNLGDDRHVEIGNAGAALGRNELQRGTYLRFVKGF
jgi:iron complex outermembrane receptor protein